MPIALVEDARRFKVSRLFAGQGPSSAQAYRTLETYFESALSELLLRECELAMDFMRSRLDKNDTRWNSPHFIAKVVRIWDMILDSSWHLADALYPARQPEYIYTVRPFWWWNIYKDLDPRTQKFRDHLTSLPNSLDNAAKFSEDFEYPLPHTIADLSIGVFLALDMSITRELFSLPPSNFDPKASKRPINILSLSGYGGSAIVESATGLIASSIGADLVRIDAQDVSELVGTYLGQNMAYSRGALSVLGFRAAELNGKIVGDPEGATRTNDDDDGDMDANMLGVRTTSGLLEDELHKIKQGGYECFSKWENLKIDKILDQIIRAVDLKSPEPRSRPILIHVHDFVELTMTLEGSLLLNKLRSIVDRAWQQGTKIAIFGTSSCEKPSDEYQNTIREIAADDFVVTRHVQPDRADRLTSLNGHPSGLAVFNLQKADYFNENLANINRMLRALQPDASHHTHSVSFDTLRAFLTLSSPRLGIMRDAILPIPEVYHLARTYLSLESTSQGLGPGGFLERFAIGPLRQKPGQHFLFEETEADGTELSESAKVADDTSKSESRPALKLNEYEKRISSGQINRENLRTSFADVHAPPETITALKLLTSLALVRPDAFSYGILAADKISGCLLYGPPGTGKTMLAKAVAKESGANMLEISGATINDKWVGESEKLIKAVFTLAKKLSPCVVFIDEADSLLANRSMFSNRASHREHINQFLKEWDGMEETNAFIMVATNRPFDLDDAVLRRLPRKILVDLPLENDRHSILKLLLRGETVDTSVSLEHYAEKTPYYSGSDLKNVCVAAAMAAVEEENEAATKHTGPEAFQYPERRILRKAHFERALKQIPSSISEDMVSLKMIRKFDEEYGNRRRETKKSGMGFGVIDEKKMMDGSEARIRPPTP